MPGLSFIIVIVGIIVVGSQWCGIKLCSIFY